MMLRISPLEAGVWFSKMCGYILSKSVGDLGKAHHSINSLNVFLVLPSQREAFARELHYIRIFFSLASPKNKRKVIQK